MSFSKAFKDSSDEEVIVNFTSNLRDKVEIFPFTYYHVNIPNNNVLKSILLNKIVEDAKELEIPEGWFTHKLMTSFNGEPTGREIFFGENTEYQDMLTKVYTECFNKIFDRKFEIAIDNIWYNVYINGEYQENHDHLGYDVNPSHFSCIHFLSFDEKNHEPVVFRDPHRQLRSLSIELDKNNYSEDWTPNIKEGDLLMFPSYLSHEVRPGKPTPDYPRISIAFNFRVLYYDSKRHDRCD